MKTAALACAALLGFTTPATAQDATKPAAPQATQPARKGGTMVVNFLGPVTSASMAEIVRAAQDAVLVGADELQINISSGGGRVYAARFAVNVLRSLPIKVVTVAMSDVGSSAVALFCAGEERYVAPGASVFLHQLTRFAERSVKTARAQEREDKIVRGWYDGMLSDCLGERNSMSEIEIYNDRDLILDDADILRLGMANRAYSSLREKRLFGRAVNVVPGELTRIAPQD
jgi:ATP-dependent protease ClpP protease subunit